MTIHDFWVGVGVAIAAAFLFWAIMSLSTPGGGEHGGRKG
jgi:hypothetical protein